MSTATLRDVPTWEALEDLYGKVAHDDSAAGLVLAEMQRREKLERAARKRHAVVSEWVDAAHAQYMQAERECQGNLVARGSKVTDAWSLWSGSPAWAMANATEELRNFWSASPRISVTQHRQQIADGKRIQRDERDAAATDSSKGEGMDEDTAPRAAEPAVTDTAGDGRIAAYRAAGRERAAVLSAQARSGVAVRAPAGLLRRREPVDGDEVLRYVFTFLKRFAVWGSDAEILVAALWVVHTHARDARDMPVWAYCARLGIFGPSGSGKSWKSRLVGKMSYKGKILVEATKPSFIDFCADHHTVIITEADEAFRSPGRSRSIVAIINASYEPDRSTSRKQGGVKVEIPLFTHIVLDGIDTLLSSTRPDLNAMISRTFTLLSARAPEGYRPPRFDAQARMVAEQLGQRATAWMAQEVEDGMADDVPEVPEWLGNRPFGKWEPLFTLAGRADRAWRRKQRAEGVPDEDLEGPGPWSAALADACDLLETGNGQAEQPEEVKDELDRVMAEWSTAE